MVVDTHPAPAATAPAAPTPAPRKIWQPRRGQGLTAAAMTAPALVLLTLFLIIPVALAFWLSTTNTRLISPNPPQSVGAQNFERLLDLSVLEQEAVADPATGEWVFPQVRQYTKVNSGYPEYEGKSVLLTLDDGQHRTVILAGDPAFWKALRNTALFAVVVVPVQGVLGLLLALLVNLPLRGVRLFRTVFFLPVVTSMVVVSLLWRFLYQKDGLINSTLGTLTFGTWDAVSWLDNPSTAMPAIMLMSVWQGVGFHMVIWLAGLQTIPPHLYEAAKIDGATARQRFRHVTVPGLRHTTIFVFVTITIAALGLFVQIDVMTQGGPLDATASVIYHAVQKGFRQQEVGYAAAVSLVFFVLVMIVSGAQRLLTREKD